MVRLFDEFDSMNVHHGLQREELLQLEVLIIELNPFQLDDD